MLCKTQYINTKFFLILKFQMILIDKNVLKIKFEILSFDAS